MHPHASVRVLSVSDHESLKLSRQLLLQSVGYSVVSMTSDCALRADISLDFEIAIIGETVDDLSACRIARILRRMQGNIRLLRLTRQYSPAGPEFDECCFAEDGPQVFLSCVAELTVTAMRNELTVPAPPQMTSHIVGSSISGATLTRGPAPDSGAESLAVDRG